ncbi:MAG: hypothetical protein PF693_03815 [Spirochaetia bacterium]|jgi:hypothetical protein|nr:hypothetical protein [Spirochaetia bacterium]
MIDIILTALLILILRIGQDTLFLAKIDAFNRGNKLYSMSINFFEAMYAITVIKIILDLMDKSIYYVLFFGLGSLLGGLVSSTIKSKLDNKLEGQRKFYARISLDNEKDRSELIQILIDHNFEFTVDIKKYINGNTKTVLQGSLDNRKRMHELKEILRGRPGKHVTIFRAEDVYLLR